jgi:RHS repeat-associated protein
MLINERTFSTTAYRFGFQGQEKDDDIKGYGNSIDMGARIYDTRLGKFLSVDPLQFVQPFQSTYCFAGNQPIWAIDAKGMVKIIIIEIYTDATGKEMKINKGVVYDKKTAEELSGKEVEEITLTIHTRTIDVYDPQRSNPSNLFIVSYGVTVSTQVEKEGGLDTRQRAYRVNFMAGLAFDFLRLSPAGQIAEGLTGKDMADGTNLNNAQVTSKILGGAISMMSMGSAKAFNKLIIDKLASKLENEVLDAITKGLGVDVQAGLKLVWSLSKLAKDASLSPEQLTSITQNLVTALKAGKAISEFINDLSNEYGVPLDVDYETIDDAVEGEAQKFAEPASNFQLNEYGVYDDTTTPNQ